MSARLHPNGHPAIATIRRREERGELRYSAEVSVADRRALLLHDRPTAQAILLDVLEWSQRQGKTVEWQFENLVL